MRDIVIDTTIENSSEEPEKFTNYEKTFFRLCKNLSYGADKLLVEIVECVRRRISIHRV